MLWSIITISNYYIWTQILTVWKSGIIFKCRFTVFNISEVELFDFAEANRRHSCQGFSKFTSLEIAIQPPPFPPPSRRIFDFVAEIGKISRENWKTPGVAFVNFPAVRIRPLNINSGAFPRSEKWRFKFFALPPPLFSFFRFPDSSRTYHKYLRRPCA